MTRKKGYSLRAWIVPALALVAALAGFGPSAGAQPQPGPDGWLPFEGSWSAVGDVQTIPIGGERRALILRMTGSIVLTAGEGLSRGFHAEAIGFDDGRGLSVGAGVWTDDRGDRIFSTMTGGAVGTGNHVSGVITGGTGRYAGVVGEYSFDWQYVVSGEDGKIQGRSVTLKGRARLAPAPAGDARR
ncbi:MAG: hypothetical protein ACHQPI_08450 [Thermoanaerobaculia bacterium]